MKILEILKIIDKVISLIGEELKKKFIHAISYLICIVLFLVACYFAAGKMNDGNIMLTILCFLVLLVFGIGSLIIILYEVVIFISSLFCIVKNPKLAVGTVLISLISIACAIFGVFMIIDVIQ